VASLVRRPRRAFEHIVPLEQVSIAWACLRGSHVRLSSVGGRILRRLTLMPAGGFFAMALASLVSRATAMGEDVMEAAILAGFVRGRAVSASRGGLGANP
jgi:hypothetical protein